MKKNFLSLLLTFCLAIPCTFSLVACEQPETLPEFDSAKTFCYDFSIHGRSFSYVIEVPTETYEGESRLATGYIKTENKDPIEIGIDFYEKGQTELTISDFLYFDVIDGKLQFSKIYEGLGFNDVTLIPQMFIPSFEMISGNYNPTQSTLHNIQTLGYKENELVLNLDGTCSIAGKSGIYYQVGLSDLIVIDNETKKSIYVKLDNKTKRFETNFKERVYGSAQLNDYYDLCISKTSNWKFYNGLIGDDSAQLTINDKYFLVKSFEGHFYFGEYIQEDNLITITVKDCKVDGQVDSSNAVLSLDDTLGTFTLVSAD